MIFRWYKNLDRSFFRFVTMHAFDRRTDNGEREFSSLDRVCIACSAVKKLRYRHTSLSLWKHHITSQLIVPAARRSTLVDCRRCTRL